MDWQAFFQSVVNWVTTAGVKILIALAILFLSFKIINAIGKRITYTECSEKRKSCSCIGDIEEIKKQLERIDL